MFEIPGLKEMGGDYLASKCTSKLNSPMKDSETSVTSLKLTPSSSSKEKTQVNLPLSNYSNGIEKSLSESHSETKNVHMSVHKSDSEFASTSGQPSFFEHSNSEEDLFEGWDLSSTQVEKKKV